MVRATQNSERRTQIILKDSKFRWRKLKESAFVVITKDSLSRPCVDINPIWIPM